MARDVGLDVYGAGQQTLWHSATVENRTAQTETVPRAAQIQKNGPKPGAHGTQSQQLPHTRCERRWENMPRDRVPQGATDQHGAACWQGKEEKELVASATSVAYAMLPTRPERVTGT